MLNDRCRTHNGAMDPSTRRRADPTAARPPGRARCRLERRRWRNLAEPARARRVSASDRQRPVPGRARKKLDSEGQGAARGPLRITMGDVGARPKPLMLPVSRPSEGASAPLIGRASWGVVSNLMTYLLHCVCFGVSHAGCSRATPPTRALWVRESGGAPLAGGVRCPSSPRATKEPLPRFRRAAVFSLTFHRWPPAPLPLLPSFFSLFIPSLFLPSSHHASSLYSRSLPSLVDPLSASLETLHHQVRRFPKKAHFQGPSQPTILSCRVFNPISKLRASKPVVKMVQSAILGFPRMGVNRDLKKATEACKLPFRISIALILFADRHRLGWQAVPGRPPRRGQAPPSCPLEDPEGCRCRRHPQQRLRPVRPGPLPHPGLWCE